MTTTTTSPAPFSELGLAPQLLSALTELGYETATPIQQHSIPVLMAGHDLVAQAQTGTGKTAAFALPILSCLDMTIKAPQALIIAPTRELAIQVAEAFQSYARHLKDFRVTSIYGGQDYPVQLRSLKRGTHVVVGTPGRLMDHLRRGSLSLSKLKTVVLDEGDEMLKMGFITDIEWILDQIPHQHQTALFSATIPRPIQKIAQRYLTNAKNIHIKAKTSTVDTIEQRYVRVGREHKLEVLTRFLEVDDIQASIIFTRTKNCAAELTEKLQARGYAAAALHGDISQPLRKSVVDKMKRGALDLIVATDVAARGIDIERISHVVNYDIPTDTESYVHRIGRTGRAGRKGKALLFVTPREQRLLRDIERAIGTKIKPVEPPSAKEMHERRSKQLADTVINVLEKSKKLEPYQQMVETIAVCSKQTPENIAAAVLYLMQQDKPLPSEEIIVAEPKQRTKRSRSFSGRGKPSPRSFNKKKAGKSTDKPSTGKRKPNKHKSK